jgi:hypothetical protein
VYTPQEVKEMGVIKQKFSLLAPEKASKKLFEVWGNAMVENGCTLDQAKTLCYEVAMMAYNAMKREYTVMGGYSADEQLFDKAQQLLSELDESGKLEEMLAEMQKPQVQSAIEVAESDLEDAYHAADSIAFTGSEKQIKWAQSIATNNNRAIALSKMPFKQLPTSAKWWIENRDDIHSALQGLKSNAK